MDLSEKRLKRYPGILIGRLAVNQEMAHQGIDTALMNFIKMWLGHGGKAENIDTTLTFIRCNAFHGRKLMER